MLGVSDRDQGRRKTLSAPKPHDGSLKLRGSKSMVFTQQLSVQQPARPSPVPAIQIQQPQMACSPPLPSYSPPMQQHHPIYGPTPQMPEKSHPVYGRMPQASPQCALSYTSSIYQPDNPPYIGHSSTSLVPSPPSPPQPSGGLRSKWDRAERLASKSCQDLSAQLVSGANATTTTITTNLIAKPTTLVKKKSAQMLNQGSAFCDRISSRLDIVLTSIDDGHFSGHEQDLLVAEDQPLSTSPPLTGYSQDRSLSSSKASSKTSNVFKKVWLYANSRLPPHLPPFKVYMPTYPLLCLAASYSERVYTPPNPTSAEVETHIKSDWRSGTKAMVLKSLPIDDMNTIVFAIRGSQTFMDWAVNTRTAPSSPEGFLDDAGNLCHAGFLSVARKMVKPVADRLRVLLEENPSRSHASLLITGHSAGGAVAALLYSHMMNTEVQSELSYLTGFFKRVHCITFGAPPVSLLPLQKSEEKRHRKSLFYSFINEGDPVPRADKAVVKSLLKLYSSPVPNLFSTSNLSMQNFQLPLLQPLPNESPADLAARMRRHTREYRASLRTASTASTASSQAPSWPITPCTLSPAGRLVVLRTKNGSRNEDDLEAVTVDDETLRGVVYGDPIKHMMKVYRKRIEALATRAATASQY